MELCKKTSYIFRGIEIKHLQNPITTYRRISTNFATQYNNLFLFLVRHPKLRSFRKSFFFKQTAVASFSQHEGITFLPVGSDT